MKGSTFLKVLSVIFILLAIHAICNDVESYVNETISLLHLIVAVILYIGSKYLNSLGD